MNKCCGWTKYTHEIEEALIKVWFEGCPYCGGGDCGDYGDMAYMCRECLTELKASKMDGYKVLEDK